MTPTQTNPVPVPRPRPMLPTKPSSPTPQLPRFTTEAPSTFPTSPPHMPASETSSQHSFNSPDVHPSVPVVDVNPDQNLSTSNLTVHSVEDSSNFTLCNSTDRKEILCTVIKSEINKNDSSHSNVGSFSSQNLSASYFNLSNSQTNSFDTIVKSNSTDCKSDSCKHSYHHSTSSNSSTYNSSFSNSSTHSFSPNGNSQSHNYAHSNMKVDRWSSSNTYHYNTTYF